MEADRGGRVSSATTLAAIGLILRRGCGFLVQSRAAVAFASGEREGASMACDQWLPVSYDRFVAGGRMRMIYVSVQASIPARLRGMPSVLQDASFAAPSFLCATRRRRGCCA